MVGLRKMICATLCQTSFDQKMWFSLRSLYGYNVELMFGGQLKILLMSLVNVNQHPKTQFILFLLYFMFYCAAHSITIQMLDKQPQNDNYFSSNGKGIDCGNQCICNSRSE